MIDYKNNQLMRERVAIESSHESYLNVDSTQFINFTSNDYLSVGCDPRIKEALAQSAKIYGLGSGSSAQVSGYHVVHQALEEQFADFLGREKAVYFGSGYLANLGAITAVVGRNDAIFIDRLCHASMIDAVILSRAKYHRYSHNNIVQLNKLIGNSGVDNKFVISESVFSMEGDLVKIDDMVSCTKNTATLIVDDAHGCGVLGENGGGICEMYNLSEADIPILITPLGKAFGSYGAIVSGKKDVVEVICQFARTYMYSTALPPIIPYATLRGLEIIRHEKWRRDKLRDNIKFFNIEAKKRSISLFSSDETPIKSISVRDINHLMETKKHLKDNGVLVTGVRPPTVPQGTSRIRISLNCFHSKSQILKLLNLLGPGYENERNE